MPAKPRTGRLVIALAAAALLAGCSEKPAEPTQADHAGPADGVDASGAPELAFRYAYSYLLPANRIAAAQEENASQCEALGPAVCHVAGLSYHVGPDRSVYAELRVKLARDAARRFGKAAGEAIGRHGGMLYDIDITSEEAGAAAEQANATARALSARQDAVNRALAQSGHAASERRDLNGEAASLNSQIAAANQSARTAALSLAATPMTLSYRSGTVDQSLTDGPVLGALKDGWGDVEFGSLLILRALIALSPWLALGGLVVWGWRRFVRARLNHDDPEA